jgi:hypothetical protein
MIFRLGKHKGKTLSEIPKSYLEWAMNNMGQLTMNEIAEIDDYLAGFPVVELPKGYENLTADEKLTILINNFTDEQKQTLP